MMDVVLVHALQLFVAEVLRQLLKPLNVEERKQPLVQDELVGKRNLGRLLARRPIGNDSAALVFVRRPVAASETLRIEHQAVEVFFDQADLPGVIGRFQVLQIVVAVDVDQAEFAVLGGIARSREPRIEHEIVLLGIAGELAPDDQRAASIRRGAGDGAEPPRAGSILAMRPLRPSRPRCRAQTRQ